jgi:hypothetical protein
MHLRTGYLVCMWLSQIPLLFGAGHYIHNLSSWTDNRLDRMHGLQVAVIRTVSGLSIFILLYTSSIAMFHSFRLGRVKAQLLVHTPTYRTGAFITHY